MIIREGCRAISLVVALPLALACCTNYSPNQLVESNLSFIDTVWTLVNGESVSREIGMMKDSLKEGLWISFYPSGTIEGIEFFENGKWNGPWYGYHKNGQLMAYRETKNGVFHGACRVYYEDGTLMSKYNFVEDKIDGLYEEYSENGELSYVIEYKDGEYVRNVYGTPPTIFEEE